MYSGRIHTDVVETPKRTEITGSSVKILIGLVNHPFASLCQSSADKFMTNDPIHAVLYTDASPGTGQLFEDTFNFA